MAADDSSTPAPQSPAPRREPLTPAKQKRLQKLFAHGSKQMTQENHDYATELFAQCVVGDPSNLTYVQSYIGNLQKKYNNNKTGSKLAQFKERGARAAVKKALSQQQWDEVVKHGLAVLKVNPWDVSTLTAMATAAEKMGDEEPELFYLKCALEPDPKNPAVNRQTAIALGNRGLYDQAIARWHKVQQAQPNNEEAQRAISTLAVEKTIAQGRYEDDEQVRTFRSDRSAGGQTAAQAQDQAPQTEVSPEEQLEQQIAREPAEMSHYFELSQLYLNRSEYAKAEEVLARAYKASGKDDDVRERWEDARLRHLRHQLSRAEEEGKEERKKKLRKKLIEKELEVYTKRCERYPGNLGFRYELGLRYQLNEQYNEAIREFQQARNDPRRKGVCMLALGQCFQHIKQHRLAMSHYESAIEEIPDRDAKNKKDALYRAGKLALAQKNLARAEKHLTSLARMDFTYRDVSALLDKLGAMRESEEAEYPE